MGEVTKVEDPMLASRLRAAIKRLMRPKLGGPATIAIDVETMMRYTSRELVTILTSKEPDPPEEP